MFALSSSHERDIISAERARGLQGADDKFVDYPPIIQKPVDYRTITRLGFA